MAGEYLHDSVLDFGLDYIATDVGDVNLRVDITSQAATTYAEATTEHDDTANKYSLGYEATITTTGPANGDASGRKITIDAISAGTVACTSGSETATHWALTDDNGSVLIAAGPLSASQSVTHGNTFSLTAFDIEIPDVTVT